MTRTLSAKTLSKAAWLALSVLFLAVSYNAASASDATVTDVRTRKVAGGVEVDVNFDGPYAAKGLKPDYDRNFAQIVLNKTGIKAARMIPVGVAGIEKIFLYQYQPGVARLRVIMKDGMVAPKGHINIWNARSGTIRILVKNAPPSSSIVERIAESKTTADEDALLKTVMKDGAEAAPAAKSTIETKDVAVSAESGALGSKVEPSRHITRMILGLLTVIGLFIGAAFFLKRYAGGLALKKMPFGTKERLIQVVASHRLGKSQAISLVKVTDEYMVMGVTGENISLIAKLGKDVDVEKYLEDRFWGGMFEKHLSAFTKPDVTTAGSVPYDGPKNVATLKVAPPAASAAAVAYVSPLRAAIKEKTTGLKPLA